MAMGWKEHILYRVGMLRLPSRSGQAKPKADVPLAVPSLDAGTAREDREDLEMLLASRGWALFSHHALALHDRSFLDHVTRALSSHDDVLANRGVRQLAAIRQAVLALLAWPDQRIADLRRMEAQHAARHQRGTR